MADIAYSALNNTTQIPQLMQQNQAAGNALKLQNLQQQSQANILATQVLSAASATGNPQLYQSAKQHLGAMGLDTTMWPEDVNEGAQFAQAARLAQSPLGSLLNAGAKMDANQIAANTAAGKATGNPNAMQYAMLRGQYVQQGGEPAGQMFDRAVQNGQVPGVSMPAAQPQPTQPQTGAVVNEGRGQSTTMPPPLPASEQTTVPQALNGAPQQPVSQQTQPYQNQINQALQNAQQRALKYAGPEPVQGNLTAAEFDNLHNQWQNKVQQAIDKDPELIQATETAKGIGSETAKQVGASAQSDQMNQKLQMNIDGLKAINSQVPGPLGASPETKVTWEKRLGLPGADKDQQALYQWNNLTHALTLNGLAQLVAQSAAGSSIRSNKTIVQLLETGTSIPSDMSEAARKSVIDDIQAELDNSSKASSNVANKLTGQPTQPMNAIPVSTGAPAQAAPMNIPLRQPSPAAINNLKANPETAPFFDQWYGNGASQVYLKAK